MTSINRTLRTSLEMVEGKRPSLREFLLHRPARNTAPGSLKFYRQKLASFFEYLEGQVTARDIRHFLVQLQETDHTAGGQHACFGRSHKKCQEFPTETV